MTNKEFMVDKVFVKSCELAGLAPSKRQASKFRVGKGKAFLKKEDAIVELNKK